MKAPADVEGSKWQAREQAGGGMGKKAPRTKQIERQGVALIATRLADLGHLWNENQNDVGIDG